MSWPKYLAFSWISLILVLNSTVRNSARVSPSFPYSVIFNKPPCALQTAYAQEGSLDGRTRMATLCRHQAAASTEDLSLFSVSHLCRVLSFVFCSPWHQLQIRKGKHPVSTIDLTLHREATDRFLKSDSFTGQTSDFFFFFFSDFSTGLFFYGHELLATSLSPVFCHVPHVSGYASKSYISGDALQSQTKRWTSVERESKLPLLSVLHLPSIHETLFTSVQTVAT